MERRYRNRDYIETVEGLFFTVIGDVHPMERVIAYLKYVPDSGGKWGANAKRYTRVLEYYTTLHLSQTFDYLQRLYPQYLYNSEVQHVCVSAVPLKSIRRHHRPELRLLDLLNAEHLDRLEKKAVDLVGLISDESHVDFTQFGITGSILVKIHNPEFSDIDLTIYGRQNGLKVMAAVSDLLDRQDRGLERFDECTIDEWLTSRSSFYPLKRNEVKLIYRRHRNRGTFKGTAFSVHPGKIETEVDERYGERIYWPEGIVAVEAVVDDVADSSFIPGIYRISSVKINSGTMVFDLREVVTYEGLYCGIISPGEAIQARGKLERVEDRRSGDVYHRILIGSLEAKNTDYLKPISGV
jgi:predicted nucleotidyltransferase